MWPFILHKPIDDFMAQLKHNRKKKRNTNSMKFLKHAALLLTLTCLVAHAQTTSTQRAEQRVDQSKSSRTTATASKAEKPSAAQAPVVLSQNQRDLARQFYTGFLSCELGKFVLITPDERAPGQFVLSHKGHQYRVWPVESRTGTLRMEDNRGHAVWIQLSHKSMLMDQKAGVRLADECKSPEQELVAQQYRHNPPQELLDGLKPGTIEARNAAMRADPPVISPVQRPNINPNSLAR